MRPTLTFLRTLLLGSTLACSQGSGSSSGSPPCFVEDTTGDPSNGCFCYTDPNDPSIATETRRRVASCRATDVSARAICCKNTKGSCGCFQANCQLEPLTNDCTCGLISSNELSSCQTGTRCCAEASGACGCDSSATTCPAEYGQTAVTSCVAAELKPTCAQYGDTETQVETCSD